ncbi:MAG: hypothetical protein KJ732_03215 [Candidatus Margulisbacteria bacterium]|nr:hypothetical protein [Candidatus Margulisiibacteriota bacterium]
MLKPKYYISKADEFVIENYNSAPTFASFFPGIAGVFGCPMWVFYANRGQCITSAGANDKDRAIIEFQPANKAYRCVSLNCFRTFIKIDGKFYEPFREASDNSNAMRITSHDLTLTETNQQLKLKIKVNYFTIPNEQFPALARIVTITNLANKPRKIEVIDGLPIVVPYGFNNDLLKRLSQTIEAWAEVLNLEQQAPFYKLKISPADVSATELIDKGNFFVSFCHLNGQDQPTNAIVEPALVFGQNSSLEIPENFVSAKTFNVTANQQTQGFTPSAFAYKSLSLLANDSAELCSIIGQVDSLKELNRVKNKISNRKYLAQKASENRSLIHEICGMMSTNSAIRSFDLYSSQTFLDNVMRGGLPISLGDKSLYLYYRKHGDMERDYNDFKLMPTYFSQGNGNYRDINQNRRNDVFFNPDVAESNLFRFFNLIQLDGFNPLVVFGSKFWIKDIKLAKNIIAKHIKEPDDIWQNITRPFILGVFLKGLDEAEIAYKTSRQELARDLIASADMEESSVHQEGFWIDHSFYNTDLLESFEAVYPEKIGHALFERKDFIFFDNDHVVLPRKGKYRLVGNTVRQYESVRVDPEKVFLINNRKQDRHVVRKNFGQGKPYYTSLIAKLLTIIANKAASFDAQGIGLEMEADKPDWYDALNGLPALFGSSLSETLELKRLAKYIDQHLPDKVTIDLPIEIKNFINKISHQLGQTLDPFSYWDTTYAIKEAFRQQVRLGISGEEAKITGQAAKAFLAQVIVKCDQGIKTCLKKYKNYHAYFINEVADYEVDKNSQVTVKKFLQKPLPLFLEGFVHALKVEKDKKIYSLVKQSPLYDNKLKMYKVNASLKDTPIEIGRARIFTPGWLENESIWLHMEYKYLLELLKAGLHDEFFGELKQVLVPFMDPKKYKRSILENSSFIASSAHPNKEKHGRLCGQAVRRGS